MMLLIFCVHDRATLQFGTPMFMVSKGQAIRSFSDEVNRAEKDNQLFTHSEDFDLFYLGSFDTELGQFEAVRPEQLVIGKDVKLKSN